LCATCLRIRKAKDFPTEGKKFPPVSEINMKEVIFYGPRNKQLFEDHDFSRKLNATEGRAWEAFKNVCRNFLSNERAENYGEIVQDLFSSYNAMGSNVSLLLHFMHFHLDFFVKTWEPSPTNMAKGSVRTFPKWEGGTLENGVQICWLTTAGVMLGRHQIANIRRSECLMKKSLVVKLPYPDALFII
jgi:hypothetical protein